MAVPMPREPETFEQAMTRLTAEATLAFNRGDAEACAGFYTEDATFLVPDRPPVKGSEAIGKLLEEYTAAGAIMAPIDRLEAGSSGDLGYVVGAFRFDTPAVDGSGKRETGKFVTVFKRQADGSWKAAIDSLIRDAAAGSFVPSIVVPGPLMAGKDSLKRAEVRDVYQKWANVYDLSVYLYYIAGMRIGHWRRLAIEAMALRPGDMVVEIGCGTGLNFALIEQQIGGAGKIIGVDISEAMLERARKRVRDSGWQNVEFVCRAAADYRFPDGIGGILSTGVLNYEPDFDKVVARGVKALASGRHWVVLDYKMPGTWQRHLAPLFVALGRPFGVSIALMDRHPWESVRTHLRRTRMREFYGGFVYIISGAAP